jgi:hypothetical protein
MHHQIWQGSFTAVNAACLHLWGWGSKQGPREEYGVLTMDVYPERLVFRRWDVRDGSEIGSDRPWSVPLPFVAETAPYNHERLKAAIPASPFPRKAKVQVETVLEKGDFAGVRVGFQQTGPDTLRYRIVAERRTREGWRQLAHEELYSGFWQRPEDRESQVSVLFPAAKLDLASSVRFAVVPLSHFGVPGERIVSKSVKTPKSGSWKTVFEADWPSDKLAYVYAKGGGVIECGADGFHKPSGSKGSRLELPKGIFAGPAGAKFRVVVDMRTEQPKNAWLWGLWLVDGETGKPVTKRQGTPAGDSGDQRWVFELVKSEKLDSDTYHLGFDWGTTSRVKFNRVRIQRMAEG